MEQALRAALGGKKHIIWDWNGTILDDVDYAVDTINWLLGCHQLPLLTHETYREVFDFPIRAYYDRLGFDYTVTSFEDLCHIYVERYMAGFHGCQPYPYIRRLLSEVRSVCEHQSVLSATDQQSLDDMISHFGFEALFDHVFGLDNKMAASKIDRGLELIETSHVSRADTLMIGDTLHDAEVADAMGIDIVLVDHGHHSGRKLLSAGRPVVHFN